MYARRGVVLDRATLAHWTGTAAELLKALHTRLLEKLKGLESSSPTRPERRCSTQGETAASSASFGRTPVTTVRGAARNRWAWRLSTLAQGRVVVAHSAGSAHLSGPPRSPGTSAPRSSRRSTAGKPQPSQAGQAQRSIRAGKGGKEAALTHVLTAREVDLSWSRT